MPPKAKLIPVVSTDAHYATLSEARHAIKCANCGKDLKGSADPEKLKDPAILNILVDGKPPNLTFYCGDCAAIAVRA